MEKMLLEELKETEAAEKTGYLVILDS